MDDERAPGAELGERLREQRHESGGVDAEDAVARTGGVRERAEHVEDGADADLLTHGRDEPHRRVVGPGEHEAEPEVVDRERDPLRWLLERDAELLEHVGRACLRARGPVAVLRDGGAGGRCHERCGGGDVERVGAVASGADDVDDGGALRRHRNDVLSHRLREAGDLVGRLALRAQGDEEPRDLRLRRLVRP